MIGAINDFNGILGHCSSIGLIFGLRTATKPVLQVCAGGPHFLIRAAFMHIVLLALDSLLVVLVVPYWIQRHHELVCLPVVFIVPEDLPSTFHLTKVFFTHVFRCISPFLRCYISLIKVFPYYPCMFSDFCRHSTIYRRAIYMLYVEHHDIFTFHRSCSSACFVFVA